MNRAPAGRWLVLAFAILGTLRFAHGRGDDLSASYVGCRLLASGQASALFDHSPTDFAAVQDPAWTAIARAAGMGGMLHPYVQTPLWVFALQPLCTRLAFGRFLDIFVLLALLALGGIVLLVTRHWATSLREAGAVACVLAALWFTEPFRYGMFLAQNHALFLFLAVLALVWAERGRPEAAGVARGRAAPGKLTPGLRVIYWLFTGRRRAAIVFVAAMIVLAGLTALSVGTSLALAYARELSRLSDVLLVAYNNQSLAATWAGRHAAASEILAWRMQPLPQGLKLASLALLATVAGGLLDRGRSAMPPVAAPLGAVLSMVATTLFTPIAWSHYYVVLVIPALLLLDAGVRRRLAWPFLLSAAIFALNVAPLSGGRGPGLLLRGQFASGLLALAGLLAVALLPRREAGSGGWLAWRARL